MTLANIRTNSFLLFRLVPLFRGSNIFAVTEHTRNQFFVAWYQKFFVVLNVHFGPIRWYPWQFIEIPIIYSQKLHFNYSFLGTISSLAEHTRKCLKIEYLGRIEYDFQKSCVTGPWDHNEFVSAKKYFKKCYACVPLKGQCHKVFDFWFFSWISFPQAPEYTIRAVSYI